MAQSDAVNNILERITQENAQVTTKKKVFGIKSRRTPKNQKPQIIKVNDSNSNSKSSESTDDFFSEQWKTIDLCVDCIFEQGSNGKFEPALQAVERLCEQKNKMFEKINEKFAGKVETLANLVCDKIKNCEPNIKALNNVWNFVQRVNTLLGSIFSTFEKSFLAPKTIEMLVWDRIKTILQNKQTEVNFICVTTVNEIKNQREIFTTENFGEIKISYDLQNTSNMISILGIENCFLDVLKEETIKFYSNFKISQNSSSHFIKNVCKIIEFEEKLMSIFPSEIQKASLHLTRENLYILKFVNNLKQDELSEIASQANGNLQINPDIYKKICYDGAPNDLLSVFIKDLFDRQDSESLNNLYSLVNNSSSEDFFNKFEVTISLDIKKRCEKALKLKSTEAISGLLIIHKNVADCKSKIDHKIGNNILRKFKQMINNRPFRIAFLLAKFCNQKILNSPTEFEKTMNDIINLFRELESMDAFIIHHQQFLSIRLLFETKNYSSNRNNIEMMFLNQMESVCGEDEILPMKKMIEETGTWNEINKEFSKFEPPRPLTNVAKIPIFSFTASFFGFFKETLSFTEPKYPVTFTTIDSNYWPNYSFKNLHLRTPSTVLDACSLFAKFYTGKNSRKKLQFLPILDTLEFQIIHNNKTLFVIHGCSMYFLVIESLINGNVLSETGIDEENLKKILATLVNFKIVIKNEELHEYSININYESDPNNNLIALPIPKILTPKKNKEEEESELFTQRSHKVEADIVFQTKKAKKMKYNELYDLVSSNFTFSITHENFDKCISCLITKGYIERDESELIVFKPD